MAFIELTNVSFTYPDRSEPAIRNLSLSIERGQFVVLFGASGSGKSTLLRLLKKEIQPHGKLSGDISINGQSVQQVEGLSTEVGFVFQDPENQVVAEDVLHELTFGLENIGLSTNMMRSRIAEMVHFFGAESLLQRKTSELSGGKKQQINLASVLLMQPSILILDEPTAQLDPVSSREFLDLLKRINDEFGMTIILSEHRLEEVFTMADKIVLMDNGDLQVEGHPKEALKTVWNSPYRPFVPTIPSLFFEKGGHGSVPLSVKEGRKWVQTAALVNVDGEEAIQSSSGEEVIMGKDLFFRYDKKAEFILKDLNFSLKKGEIYALMGGNGSGKSTFLKVMANLLQPSHGKLFLHKNPLKAFKQKDITQMIGYLPQNPKLFFIEDTIEKEIQATAAQWGVIDQTVIDKLLEHFGISHLMASHPYDLSGGELQKAALVCLLLRKPQILLLDEPTKGLDPLSKDTLATFLQSLREDGITTLMSTHDVEFAAKYATKCGILFQGMITSEDVPQKFFNGNFFYTTMVQRLFWDRPAHTPFTKMEGSERCVIKS